MDAFSETDKLAFRGEADDENMFHFTCFETDDTCESRSNDLQCYPLPLTSTAIAKTTLLQDS